MIYGHRVTELRKKLSLSKQDLAIRVGVSTATITNWENSKSTPTLTLLAVKGDKTAMCFPVAFVIAGLITAMTAKHNGEKSVCRWWLYGAFVPFISWIDVVMLNSQNKTRAFIKNLTQASVRL